MSENGKLHPCECSQWEIVLNPGTEEANLEDYEGKRIVCTRQTKRTFAQGHDASLKSLLIEAGVGGYEVARVGEDDGIRRDMDWHKAAMAFGFGHQVVEAVQARTAKKTAKKAPKSEIKADTWEDLSPAEAPKVRVKVGRWEYDAIQVQGGYNIIRKDESVKFVPADKAKLI
jgi:hypothetical protein